jgi:hypothetical protein
MGSSGEVGTGVEQIYESFQNPKRVAGLIVNFVKNNLPDHALPKLFGMIDSEEGLTYLVSMIAERIIDRERNNDTNLLSPDASEGLKGFAGALIRQIDNEIEKRPEVGLRSGYDLTLVLGHTHKPFSWNTNSPKRPPGIAVPQQIYNTGGWIVESTAPATKHGASVVLVDENLSTACIRLYNETEDDSRYGIRVETADPASPDSLAFLQTVEASVDKHGGEWDAFTGKVARTDNDRRNALKARTS